MVKILQWNAQALIKKWPLAKPFLADTGCEIYCLQETHFFQRISMILTCPITLGMMPLEVWRGDRVE